MSLSQAHPVLVEKLRISQPGQLWAPFFLINIWVILRLDHWQGSRLDDSTRQILLDDLFSDWLQKRVEQLLRGEEPPPLPGHVLTQDLDQPGASPSVLSSCTAPSGKTAKPPPHVLRLRGC